MCAYTSIFFKGTRVMFNVLFCNLLLQLMHFKHPYNVNYQEHWYFTVVMVDQYHEVVECTHEPVVMALSCQTNFLNSLSFPTCNLLLRIRNKLQWQTLGEESQQIIIVLGFLFNSVMSIMSVCMKIHWGQKKIVGFMFLFHFNLTFLQFLFFVYII